MLNIEKTSIYDTVSAQKPLIRYGIPPKKKKQKKSHLANGIGRIFASLE